MTEEHSKATQDWLEKQTRLEKELSTALQDKVGARGEAGPSWPQVLRAQSGFSALLFHTQAFSCLPFKVWSCAIPDRGVAWVTPPVNPAPAGDQQSVPKLLFLKWG